MSPLGEACHAVMRDDEARSRHPEGMTSVDVLDEIRQKEPGAFPLCTWLDVHDVMTEIYGAGRRG